MTASPPLNTPSPSQPAKCAQNPVPLQNGVLPPQSPLLVHAPPEAVVLPGLGVNGDGDDRIGGIPGAAARRAAAADRDVNAARCVRAHRASHALRQTAGASAGSHACAGTARARVSRPDAVGVLRV